MKNGLVLLLFLLSLVAYAQETPRTSTVKVNPVPQTEEGGSLLFPKKEKEVTPFFSRSSERPAVNMRTDSDLLDPGVQFQQQKFFKVKENPPGFITTSFLGEFRTGEKILTFSCRDYGAQDGDIVRIWVDGEIRVEKLYLFNQFQSIQVFLKPGFNKIEVEAISQGSIAPNTAEFIVRGKDGNIVSKNTWSLNPGMKATMIIIKD